MNRCLVTGAGGFIGEHLCKALIQEGHRVRALMRDDNKLSKGKYDGLEIILGDLFNSKAINGALMEVDVVIHLAGRVHRTEKNKRMSEEIYKKVNLEGTKILAQIAANQKVKRFVFISSVKAMGESTRPDQPFTEDSKCNPVDLYGMSKFRAELALRRIANETDMEIVILRLPLVYGPGVKANFLRLMHVVDSGFPLPLGSISNKRSLLFIGNLIDVLIACLNHPMVAGETFLVSDGENLSTPEIVVRLANSLNRTCRLIPFPAKALRLGGRIVGKSATIDRLVASLTVDSSKIRDVLKWHPRHSVSTGLRETAAWYKSEVKSR